MNKTGLRAAIGLAAVLAVLAAGGAIFKAATARPPAQTGETIDINELMKTIDIRALPKQDAPSP